MECEGEGDPHPEQEKKKVLNITVHKGRKADNGNNYTFCKLSLLPNGEFKGELLRVYVLGLFASEGIPSLLDSVLHFL